VKAGAGLPLFIHVGKLLLLAIVCSTAGWSLQSSAVSLSPDVSKFERMNVLTQRSGRSSGKTQAPAAKPAEPVQPAVVSKELQLPPRVAPVNAIHAQGLVKLIGPVVDELPPPPASYPDAIAPSISLSPDSTFKPPVESK
jgi:hypothetical protein